MKKKTKGIIRAASALLFLMYLVLLTYFLFFSERFGRAYTERAYAYNLKPFREIGRFWMYREQLGFAAVFTNIAGNILCFVPFGTILPVLTRRARNPLMIVLLGLTFSLLVECAQLVWRVGSFDVDDLMLNTLGSFLGYLLFALCDRWRRRRHG